MDAGFGSLERIQHRGNRRTAPHASTRAIATHDDENASDRRESQKEQSQKEWSAENAEQSDGTEECKREDTHETPEQSAARAPVSEKKQVHGDKNSDVAANEVRGQARANRVLRVAAF